MASVQLGSFSFFYYTVSNSFIHFVGIQKYQNNHIQLISFFNFNFSRRKLIPVYEIIISNDLPLGLRSCVNVINQNGLPEIRLA